jgi:hypothetical protein
LNSWNVDLYLGPCEQTTVTKLMKTIVGEAFVFKFSQTYGTCWIFISFCITCLPFLIVTPINQVKIELLDNKHVQDVRHLSPSDWFNLGIEDIPEVVIETKKALKGQLLTIGSQPLCVEISLKTVEGDSLILENWCLSVNETSEPFNRVSCKTDWRWTFHRIS